MNVRRRNARLIPAVLLMWGALLCVAVWLSPRIDAGNAEALRAAQSPLNAGYVGSETCAVCHQDQFDNYRGSVHFQTETGDWPTTGCESCHGPGEAHIDNPENVRLIFDSQNTLVSASDKAGQCLDCHASEVTNFDYRAGTHMQGAVDCSSCHLVHDASGRDRLLAGAQTDTCLGCHQEVRAELSLNERHRVLEGMVTCADCHEQHGQSARSRLGGFKQQTCIGCHTDKGGPFVFEHLSNQIEGCTSCHVPHGSPNRHLLQYQANGDLCYSCHVAVPGFHKGSAGPNIRFDSTTNCVNCHSTIHGSNLDSHFLR